MGRRRTGVLLVAGLAAAWSCTDHTAPLLVSDAQVTADVAASAGDQSAAVVEGLIANEAALALPGPSFEPGPLASPPSVTRTRTCYDAADAVVANCAPMASVVKIVVHVQEDGSRSGPMLSGVVHRTRDLTVVRHFSAATPPVETSRTHDGVGTSHDTTSFSGGAVSRTHAESSVDSVVGVTFALPHLSNPFPTAGKLVRHIAAHVTVMQNGLTQSRDVQKRVEVDFPADAQGNVTLKVDNTTCSLNLVTHAVTNCR
jgi:hypothetical protein